MKNQFSEKHIFVLIFALYGSWEAGNSLKILSRGVGTFSTIEDIILRTFNFRFFFRPFPDLPHLTNLAAKNAHAMAPCLSLTHPERCAAKFCTGKCQKFLGISHLRPNRDQNVVPKWNQNATRRQVAPSNSLPEKSATRLALGRSHLTPFKSFCL